MSSRYSLAAALLCVTSLSACACTAIYVPPGLHVEVVTNVTLPPGDYAFIARVEGVEIRLDRPLASSGNEMYSGDVALGGRTLFLEGLLGTTGGFVQVGFREGGGPGTVTLELWHGQMMVAEQTYSPDYEATQPNGATCGDVTRARDTLEVNAF